GHPPLRGKDYQDTLSQIVERDPVEPRKVDARIPRDLEMIVLKCLRKEAAGRYGTAEALAQDLRRFVRGDPIEARPESRLERLSRRLRRNRAVLLAGAVLVLLLGAVGWQAAERYIAEQEARDAVRLLHDATVRDAAIEIFAGQQELLGRSSEELSKFLYVYRGWRYRKGVAGVADTLWALEQAAEAAPGRPDAPYYLARLYRLAGDEESAAREAARALERAPDFVPAAILAREIALDRGRLGETEIEPLLERFGGKPEPNWQEPWLLAYRHVQIRAWPEAVEAYRKLLQYREPEPYVGFTVEALMGCGLARLQTGEFLGATSDFAAARGIWPKLSDAGFALGMAWHHAGQEEEAERVFLELHGESPEGSRSEIAAWITGVYWMAGEAAKAREWLERVESPDRDGIDCNGLYLRGRYEECIKKAQQVLETYPDAYFTLFQLCWAKLQLQWHRRGPRWDDERREILEIARKAIDLYPNDRHAKVQLAYALQVNGRPEEALRTIENAVRSTSRISDVLDYDLVVYGVILRLQGKLQKAEEVLLEAVENCPRFKYFFAFELARTYECAGRDEEAEREYRALTAGGGGSANVYGCLAGVLNRLGRYKEAADAAKEALRRLPKNTCAHEELARALWKLGRSEEAIEAADVGIQEIPGREHLYLLKGKIVEDLGKVEEAAKEYCLELDLRLDDPETHEALRGLLKRTPELASIPEVAAVADAIERRVSDGSRDAFVLETLSLIRKSEKEAIGAPAHTGK
ncbi:MAG: tetratricopeptide repeat protein, partial [Planctomycetes bacterium]|nr:tetratricopeptide repeat protein [Planctomycetota bacterium]